MPSLGKDVRMPIIAVIGGVAAGTSAASQAKRRLPDADVILLELGSFVSYSACGIPYNLQDPLKPIEELVVVSAGKFRSERHVDVRLRHEVLAIEPKSKRLRVRDHAAGQEYALEYDELVISTGAQAVPLQVTGRDLPGVFLLRELSDGAEIKQYLADHAPKSAIVVGGGYIGMEMAEALRALGLSVRLLEKGPDVVPGFDPQIAQLVREELAHHDVSVETGVTLKAIESDSKSNPSTLVLSTDHAQFTADLVLIATGIRPNVALASAAGVQLGETGAIAVDDRQRTNLAHVWAAGDCAESVHRVTGKPVWIPLGTTANKQGKVAGANAAGCDERFFGIVGTAVFKLFDLQVARTGLGPSELKKLGIDALVSVSTHKSRASSVSGAEPIRTLLFVERETGRLLGAQMAGRDGVAHRIDVFATALSAGLNVKQIEALDLAYAPPFAQVYDPITIAATVARKALAKGSED
jgi:NADPH-dependent 2,4-dienoyl-CoA reductase/sulfur reductase-like enzyme